MDNLITIRQLRINLTDTQFLEDYENLILGKIDSLDDESKVRLLKIAIVLLNFGDTNLEKLGYRIIVRYSNLFNDYKPLFDVSLNLGYIPVSKFIESNLPINETQYDHFFNSFFSAFQDNFKQQNIYLSYGQKKLITFSSQTESNYVLVAPTSYGKSEIIINEVYQNHLKKVCIIVPTKALLAQTKKRLIENELFASLIQRVITHPDMYKGDEENFVSVLTQERLLRLLQKNPSLSLDLVLIDEAHNLLNEDHRAVLLSQVLLILKKRNASVLFKFFTPFISDPNNLKIPYASYNVEFEKITEYIKVERFYVYDFTTDKKVYLYDQFLNDFLFSSEEIFESDIPFLIKHKAKKNIVYLNRPKDIEKLAMELQESNLLEEQSEIEEAYNAISEFVHTEYNLLKCIRSGIVYHHGGMPELVRLYVESLFSKISQLQFIVTSSTLLEGVNIPAERIFLLTTKIGRKNFSKSQFKNLIGRVCRFSEVFRFSDGNLRMLEPEIYILKGNYEWPNANSKKFLTQKAKIDINIEDDIENILMQRDTEDLTDVDKHKLNNALEYLENIEPDTIDEENINYVESDIAKLCYTNNVYDFDIRSSENTLVSNLERYNLSSEGIINDVSGIMEAIYQIFIENITITEQNIERLSNEPARRFYAMFLDWRIHGSSYNQMVAQFIRYWNRLTYPIIYVGSKWGETKYIYS